MGPSCGTSCTRSRLLTWSSVSSVGERPPCRQKIASSTVAVSGRKSKRSVKCFQTLALPYLRRHSS